MPYSEAGTSELAQLRARRIVYGVIACLCLPFAALYFLIVNNLIGYLSLALAIVLLVVGIIGSIGSQPQPTVTVEQSGRWIVLRGASTRFAEAYRASPVVGQQTP